MLFDIGFVFWNVFVDVLKLKDVFVIDMVCIGIIYIWDFDDYVLIKMLYVEKVKWFYINFILVLFIYF